MPIFSSVFFTRVLSGFAAVCRSESPDVRGPSFPGLSSSASSGGAGGWGTLTLRPNTRHKNTLEKLAGSLGVGLRDLDEGTGWGGSNPLSAEARQRTQLNSVPVTGYGAGGTEGLGGAAHQLGCAAV